MRPPVFVVLMHPSLNKTVDILQTTFSNTIFGDILQTTFSNTIFWDILQTTFSNTILGMTDNFE